MLSVTILWMLMMMGTGAGEQPTEGVLAPGARLEKLAGGFAFTEGPTADAEGNVYFTDQPNDRILKWSVDDVLSTFLQPAGRSNGMAFDGAGSLWTCADERNELWRIDGEKHVTVVVKDFGGKLLNGPNDVWAAPGGGLYFTDPLYKRPYWKRGPMEQAQESVFFLAPDHKALRLVAGDLVKPNGIVGTPDGRTLYVADIGAGKTYSYAIQPDGALAEKTLFCSMGSDGITLDDQGHLYLTGKGVTIFDRTGRQVAHIPVDEPWTANVCFGGRDGKSLFITASTGLYRIRTRVRGAGRR
jgi:gluconolactonase